MPPPNPPRHPAQITSGNAAAITNLAVAQQLVVGAGPTGLTLAAQLQALGASLRIVDRQPDRVHESRALAVQPRTLELLRGLGLVQELLARGNDAVWVQLHAGGRTIRIRLFGLGLDDTAYPFLLFVSQAETEQVLNDHLATRGVQVERRVELVGFHADPTAVTCTLRHADGRTEQLRTRYLVGCDGAASNVRRGAGIPFQGGAYPQTFALADLEVDGGLDADTAYAFLGQEGLVFLFPLGRPASWRLLGMHPTLQGKQEPERPSLQELQALADAFTGGRLRLRDPVWLTYFRLAHRHAARYRAGRVLVAGDAAHVHSPAGAQGMNTGIQDAWNLGWKLALVARGVAAEALLDSYDAERRPIGRFVVGFTDRAYAVATSPTRSSGHSVPGWSRGCCRWRCGSPGRWRTAFASSPSSASATGTARPSRKAARRCAEGQGPATGCRMRASPKTGRWAGWARRWPRHASTYCCAAPPTPGTPTSSPPSARATATSWPYLT
jgi:2-polyprenyl-6-methoxyphenol hydroxylase-like FAD-dependent oxidoreductase